MGNNVEKQENCATKPARRKRFLLRKRRVKLAQGKTEIVYVPIAHADALRHVARLFPTVWFTVVAHEGKRPKSSDYEYYKRVPEGHVAVRFTWRQKSAGNPVGVPQKVYEKASEKYQARHPRSKPHPSPNA